MVDRQSGERSGLQAMASICEDLYQQLISINERAFLAGFYDTAFHALSAALYCANELKSNEFLLEVSKTASAQLTWIDTHHPEYRHSTQSAARRGQAESIFSTLSQQAKTMAQMHKG